MLKPLKRILTALVTASASHQVTRAAVIEPVAEVMSDADCALREVEYDHQVAVRPEYLANYSGPRTPLTPELMAQIRGAKKWRNSCITAREETNEFVEARTR